MPATPQPLLGRLSDETETQWLDRNERAHPDFTRRRVRLAFALGSLILFLVVGGVTLRNYNRVMDEGGSTTIYWGLLLWSAVSVVVNLVAAAKAASVLVEFRTGLLLTSFPRRSGQVLFADAHNVLAFVGELESLAPDIKERLEPVVQFGNEKVAVYQVEGSRNWACRYRGTLTDDEIAALQTAARRLGSLPESTWGTLLADDGLTDESGGS